MEENQTVEELAPEAEAPAAQEPSAGVTVVDIQFRPGQKVYYFDPDGVTYAVGDAVIIDTARGEEYGTITAGNHEIQRKDVVAPLRKVLRAANAKDQRINAENRAREKRAFEVCVQKVAQHGLDMQTVSAECAFDGSKILFYFTADERVDFRELVKDLASVFHTRIELRQIGVRDKARMVGGLGICGRPFCCASFLDDFQPVSIKMAKTQNLSLNPTKISGTCGRLMCCLKYEQDTYEDLLSTSPRVDSFVDTPEGRGTVVESEILRQRVKVRMEENPETISVFANEDIAVLRSGRGKKNDPPIPADLAPISGSGKRAPRQEPQKEQPVLDSIRFRYSTEAIAEERSLPEQTDPAREQPAAEGKEERRRRPGRRDHHGRREEEAREAQGGEKKDAPEKKENSAGKDADKKENGEGREQRRSRPPRKPRAPREGSGEGEAPRQKQPRAAGQEQPQQERKPRQERPHRQEGGDQPEGEKPAEKPAGFRRPNNRRHRPRGPRPEGEAKKQE